MQKPTAKQLWDRLVDEAGEEEIERAASVSVGQAESELAAAGFDVAAERASAEAFLAQLAGAAPAGELAEPRAVDEMQPRPTSPEPIAAVPAVPQEALIQLDLERARRRPRPLVLWIAAAATVTVGGGALYVALHQTPAPAPAPQVPAPSTPQAPPVDSAVPDLVAAADLRHRAVAACNASLFEECIGDLERARVLDPEGETPEYKTLLQKAYRSLKK